MAHPKKRLAVSVYSTIAPERIMPNGDAAVARAPRTEVTLPCISMGTTVCLIVWIDTLATGMQKAMVSPAIAMNQNCPAGVRAIRAYPRKMTYIETTAANIFLLKPFTTSINSPPARTPPWKKAMTNARSGACPKWSNLT